MMNAIAFLFRITFTIIWALVLSKLIRDVAWPWIKAVWTNRPELAFNWK